MTDQPRTPPPTHRAPLALLADEGDRTSRLAGLLEGAWYIVLREHSGQRALDCARANQPDVIIIASDLPDIPGIELCRTLHGDVALRSSPPIVLAFAQPATTEDRVAALRAGASECVTLPLDSEEVVLKADAHVHTKRDADRERAQGLLDPNTGLYNQQGLARRARELGSQAFREHGPLACIVLALEFGPEDAGRAEELGDAVRRGVHALQAVARRSDVIGRLGPTEFAVLAPGTNAVGARLLAKRLAESLNGGGLHVRSSYEAVANVGYTPIEPVELLVRAAAAVRTGRVVAGT